MLDEMRDAPEVVRPSAFWEQLNEAHLRWLEERGFDAFKRTVNQQYFQFVPVSPFTPREARNHPLREQYRSISRQFRAVLGRSLRRPTPRVLSASLVDERATTALDQLPSRRARKLYAIYVAALWEEVGRRGGRDLLDRLEEPALGSPISIHYRGRSTSEDLCNSVLELISMTEPLPGKRPPPGGVIELGAGYGRLAWVFLSAFPDTRYIVVDIPPALAVSERYLSELFPDRRIFRFRHFREGTEVEEELARAQVAFLTPNQLDLISPLSSELFVTISSLHEMRPEQIDFYLHQVARHCDGYFYFKQWQESVNPPDQIVIRREDYPIPADWVPIFDRPHPVQTAFFEAMYRLPGDGSLRSEAPQRPEPAR